MSGGSLKLASAAEGHGMVLRPITTLRLVNSNNQLKDRGRTY